MPNSAFSQAYVLRIRALFSPAETSFTALSFCSFRNKFLFRFMPSQKAITSYCLDQVILYANLTNLAINDI